ncbi:MAG: hypothetical protein QOH93_3422 [Chloroflexia bacterium]|jgi:hypothetical protein|nr:hypothetical protein [Chloroflexia bacterium]
MFERDSYTEAHRKGPGWGLFIAWVITCVLTAAAGETISGIIGAYVPREGAGAWLNYLLTGTAIGAVIGLGQGLLLKPFLGSRGMAEWVLMTVVGRVGRIFVLAVLVDLMSGTSLSGNFFLIVLTSTLIYATIGASGGFLVGITQSLVLERWVTHARWWVVANMGASAVAIGAGYWLPDSTPGGATLRLFSGLVIGVITGIALNDLLRDPLPGQGRWLTWKRERPVSPGFDPGTQPSPEALLEEMRSGRQP